jgi:uncharacterized protein YegP (UPF0339 family)
MYRNILDKIKLMFEAVLFLTINMKLTFYQDTQSYHRWKLVSSNWKIVAASSESFVNKNDCIQNANLTRQSIYSELRRL